MEADLIVIPEKSIEHVKKELDPLVAAAESLVILDKPTHALGQQHLTDLAGVERNIKKLFADPKTAAHAAHKSVCAAEKTLLDPITTARRSISNTLNTYEIEQERVQRIEQRKAEEEARKVQDEQALLDAITAEDEGDAELAADILEEAADEPPPVAVVEGAVAKTQGVSVSKTYSAEVTSLVDLVKFVAENPAQINLLLPNGPALNQLARAMRDNLNIPGVKVVVKRSQTVRAA